MSNTMSPESSAVQHYLDLIQGIINRMAANSASAKTWCVALVAALLSWMTTVQEAAIKTVPAATSSTATTPPPTPSFYAYLPLAILLPILAFGLLDAYYLGLERQFVAIYTSFVSKLHAGKAEPKDLYQLRIDSSAAGTLSRTAKAILSVSIWLFYGLLLILAAGLWTLWTV